MPTYERSTGRFGPGRDLLQSLFVVRRTLQLGVGPLPCDETDNGVRGRRETQQDRQESFDRQQSREFRRGHKHGE